MIRFRNPGTQYTTQVQVFRELYKEYKDAPSFDLDDMAATIAKTKLMTAYGYAGDAALALSNTENDSLNSTKMNAKMYAEVFRLLGWVTSAGDNSYPLVFTYIGEHAAWQMMCYHYMSSAYWESTIPKNNGCQIRRKGSFLQGYIVLIAGFRRDYV